MWTEPSTPNLKLHSSETLLVVLWLACLFLWTLAPVMGYDFWFYLGVGRDILTQGRIPSAESYLGTTSSLGFKNYAETAWLGNLVTYAVYSVSGYLGLVFLKSSLLVFSTAVVYVTNRLSGMVPFWAGAWSTLALWTIRGRFELRLYLFTTLALALLSLILIYLERGGSRKYGAVALGALFALWTNLHQGVLAGYIVAASWFAFGRRPFIERFSLVTIAVLSSFLRPNALSQPTFYYDVFSNSRAMKGVVEWGPVSWEDKLTHLSLFYFVLVLIGISALRKLIQRKRLPPVTFGVTATAFALMGWRSYRSIAEILPIVCPMAATYSPTLPSNKRLRFAVTLLLLALISASFNIRNLRALNEANGVPLALSRLIPKQGQVFNSFEFGNFLVFQNIPPFIHGMSMLYQEQLVADFEAVLNPTSRRDELLTRYNITSALLHFPTEDDATSLLVEHLSNSKDWKLEAWDDNGLLFVKGAQQSGLVAVKPWQNPGWSDSEAAESELRALLARHPSSLGHIYLSRILLANGNIAEATHHATIATQLSPNSYNGWTQLGGCYAKASNLAGLLLSTEEAISLAPDIPQVKLNRSLALYSASQNQSGVLSGYRLWRARQLARQAVIQDPSLAPSAKIVINDSH